MRMGGRPRARQREMEEMVVGGRVEVAVEVVMGGMVEEVAPEMGVLTAMEEEVAVGVAGVPGQAGMASHGIGSSPKIGEPGRRLRERGEGSCPTVPGWQPVLY